MSKRAKTDPREKFSEMFAELYSTKTGAKKQLWSDNNAVRRHKAFFKKNPDIKVEFDAYCTKECERLRAEDSKKADEMRPIIDVDKAETEFRFFHKRGMEAKDLNIDTLCNTYTYEGIADKELARKSRQVCDHLRALYEFELAFDHCLAQYDLAERFSTKSHPKVDVCTFLSYGRIFNRDALVKRLVEAGFDAADTNHGIIYMQRKFVM